MGCSQKGGTISIDLARSPNIFLFLGILQSSDKPSDRTLSHVPQPHEAQCPSKMSKLRRLTLLDACTICHRNRYHQQTRRDDPGVMQGICSCSSMRKEMRGRMSADKMAFISQDSDHTNRTTSGTGSFTISPWLAICCTSLHKQFGMKIGQSLN